jgi:hypothetical protein
MIAETLSNQFVAVTLRWHATSQRSQRQVTQKISRAKVQFRSVSSSKASPSAVCQALPRDKGIEEIIVSGAVTNWFGASL